MDPDGTTTVNGNRNEPKEALLSLSHDLHEEEMEEEDEIVNEEDYGDRVGDMTSPAPVILGERGILPNSTGNTNNFSTRMSHRPPICFMQIYNFFQFF